jgi:hypothetical protein
MKALRDGIGPAFAPLLRRWTAKLDQQSARGWLEVTKTAGLEPRALAVETVDGRADIRLTAERRNHQQNREVIALNAVEETKLSLVEGLSPVEGALDPEWLALFWRLAQEIGSAEKQSLWGRILSRQAVGAGNMSPRSLHALSLLDGRDIALLTALAPLVVETRGPQRELFLIMRVFSPGHYGIAQDLSAFMQTLYLPSDLAHLANIGLMSTSGAGHSAGIGPSGVNEFWVAGKHFQLRQVANPIVGVAVVEPLTRLGAEIVDLIRAAPNKTFIQGLAAAFIQFGYALDSRG